MNWVIGPAQIFGEELHKESLAYALVATYKQRLCKFKAFVGKYLLGEGTVVEVVQQKDYYLIVVIINHELAPLWGKNNILSDTAEEIPVTFENVGVGQIGE